MSKKTISSAAKVGGIKKKVKLNEKSNVINDLLLRLIQCTREYVLSDKSNAFVREFHKNQTILVEDTLWYGDTNTKFIASKPSIAELKEKPVSISDAGYKRMGVFLQLNPNETEDFDDLINIDEQDVSNFKVSCYAAIMSVYKDHVQLKVVKGTPRTEWFYDSYYYRLPLNFIDLFVNGEDIGVEVRRSYEKQEFPSDTYLINHLNRFIEVILYQLYKKKYYTKSAGLIVKTELLMKNSEKYTFKIWQDE